MTRYLIGLIIATALFSSCETDPPANALQLDTGYLRNYTGLDGCGWVIINADNQAMEPINLGDFGLELVDYAPISFTYTEVNSVSICMVGPIIELVTVKME
ncbi:MAG TPA: hypothetical protein PK511_07720 [Chitinophagales bacterium]|nr:hypothetical protein [Chitinophagales bacterium]HMU69767.1 hypothetical protein [Chitinophagales bacterium]HMX04009.1 hypothetical protein [Chitinophagales bacterium]HMZ88076.1 hypothetical protein [Chitinophagales bacterium]HNA59138.1 hypothetical protein [Chitinophagales bacterium]